MDRGIYPNMGKGQRVWVSGKKAFDTYEFPAASLDRSYGGALRPPMGRLGRGRGKSARRECPRHPPPKHARRPGNPHISTVIQVRIAAPLTFRGLLVAISSLRTTKAPGPTPGKGHIATQRNLNPLGIDGGFDAYQFSNVAG